MFKKVQKTIIKTREPMVAKKIQKESVKTLEKPDRKSKKNRRKRKIVPPALTGRGTCRPSLAGGK
jgi:hypothetical protein